MHDQPSDANVGSTSSSKTGASREKIWMLPIHRSWKMSLVVAIAMLLLAMLGVGLTTTSRAIAPTYWISLVPVYAVLCIVTAWSRSRYGDGGHFSVLRQVFHWLAIAVALWVDFFIRGTGQETGVAAGLNAVLLLALGCILAGVHLEWLFSLVGALLLLTLFVVVKADQYLWLILFVGLMTVLALVWVMRLLIKADAQRSRPSPSNPAVS